MSRYITPYSGHNIDNRNILDDERSRIVTEMLRMNTLSYINGLGPLLLRLVCLPSDILQVIAKVLIVRDMFRKQ